ncbi:Triosephosphate isomerase [Metallosphaera sp. J1]|uniref:triose-phosphate isomerase n=1 Tax=Metallosphaera javensis (ex Hofmann et al. 2022) TaxID=99938 RepID=UPI001EE00B35|nr:triose-phosphate isomerase [Metallosphaera javensis (ex Hofmann et al. 2022)]MCG3108211.1 Triosephosphate isomerase [Metallosphaera javensis (ex Hofmann et al. 2022)]
MKVPIILVNYKVYETSYGKRGLEMAKIVEKVALETSTEIIVAVPATMITRVAEMVSIPVYAQHVDGVPEGAHTGAITPELIKDAGARGSLLNHSEKRMRMDEMDDALKRMRKLGLESVVCVDRYELVAPMALLKPTAVLVEPPELIGSGISVSKARPEVITSAVDEIRKVEGVYLVAGAGITSGEDVYVAMKLGSDGVGAASAIMKAKEPQKVLLEFVNGAIRALEERGGR